MDDIHQIKESAASLLIGETIGGKYRITSFVNRGAIGVVYKAVQLSIEREVALKVLQPNLLVLEADPNFAERFRREASIYGRLRHPNTVVLYDYGEHLFAGRPLYYMAMEYVTGQTLRQAMRRDGRFSPERAMDVAMQVCRSLREAHGLGIVHRDLKPGNIMLTDSEEGERVKVLDFGVAKLGPDQKSAHEDDLTRPGTALGSPPYMSPEQIQMLPVDGRTDIYALGCILFEMLAGAPPFRGNGTLDTCSAHLANPVPSLNAIAGAQLGVPPHLEAVVRKCLEKRPEQRFQTVDDLAATLRMLRENTDSLNLMTLGSLPIRGQVHSRSLWMWVAVGLLAVGLPTVLVSVGVLVAMLVWAEQPQALQAQPELPADAPSQSAEPAQPSAQALEQVTIGSEPSGAEVWRGGERLGSTPLALDAASLRAGGPIVLKHSGYRDATLNPATLAEGTDLTVIGLIPQPAPAPVPTPAPGAPRPADLPFGVRTER